VVLGNAKCRQCLKGKKGCKFPVEEEKALEGEEDVKEVPTVSACCIPQEIDFVPTPFSS
jgi:hypothetical protein